MVSPLKTWQHPQPKGLWPAVTGLAVATHVGILSLALPYVLNLMRPGESQAADFVPIELIDVAPTKAAVEEAQSAKVPEGSEPATASNTSGRTAPSVSAESTRTANNSALTASSNSVVSAVPTPDVLEEKPASQPERPADSEVEPPTAPEDAPEDAPETEPIPKAETTPDTESSNSADDSSSAPNLEPKNETSSDPVEEASETFDAEPSNTAPPTDDTVSEVTEPPVIPGEQVLPTPEEGGETAVSSAQVAYIKVVGHSYVPEDLRRDIADTLPEPAGYTGIELDAESVGCGQLEFPVGQVAYRVVVGPAGTVRQALPWTGGIEGQQMSGGESAIACLIESAGFSFSPATSAGTPVANSDLILTLDVIESSGN